MYACIYETLYTFVHVRIHIQAFSLIYPKMLFGGVKKYCLCSCFQVHQIKSFPLQPSAKKIRTMHNTVLNMVYMTLLYVSSSL